MRSIERLVLLNQMAGPLFRELAEGLTPFYPGGVLLITGYSDTLNMAKKLNPMLVLKAAPQYDKRSYPRRLCSWFHYLAHITFNVLLAKSGDVILLTSNPPLLGPWVWFLTLFHPAPYAVLVYDVYPDVFEQGGMIKKQGLIAQAWRYINRLVYHRAKVVVTIGNRMAIRLQQQIGVNGPAISIVSPWVDVEKIYPLQRECNPYATKFIELNDIVVLYSGNMGISHDIGSILEAAKLLRHKSNIRFVFIGDGERRQYVETYVRDNPGGNVKLFPFQPEAMVPFTLSLGDISIVTTDDCMGELMIPSKIFFYMAAGSAVIAITKSESELPDLINFSKFAKRVDTRSPRLLANTILDIANDATKLESFKRSARVTAELHYSKSAGIEALVSILDQAGLIPPVKLLK